MEVKIEKFDHLGNGIGKIDEKVVFVKRSLPDEIVDVKIIDERKKYAFGKIKKIIKNSDNRNESICPYYDKCGGCDFLHTTEEVERDFKKEKASDLISDKLCFYDTKEFNYRNKVILHGDGSKLGFYEEKTNNIIDIDYCYLLDERINKVIRNLKKYIKENKCFIKEVMIRVGDEIILNIDGIVDKDFINTFSSVENIIINNKVIKGKGFIEKNLLNYNFKISPKSFFQVNYYGLECIYKILKENLSNHYKKALDLYSGTSVMGILISDFCDKVISVESNESATNDALINIENNNIKNIEVINAKVETVIDKLRDVDLIIIDPPRSGLDKKTISYINEINPQTLIYISCNMITLKRDLQLLNEKYDLKSLNLVNMFPKTYHVESVCVLKHE